MQDINYFGGVVKILENPTKTIFATNILCTRVRVQLPQIRKNRIGTLIFWGNLGQDISNYYKVNDYLLIEGYLSLPKKKVEITVFKVSPFFLNYNYIFENANANI